MIKKYEKLIKIINKNIIKLTNQLKFLNDMNDNLLIQYGGGLESQMTQIDDLLKTSFEQLKEKIITLDSKIKDYEENKKKNIFDKLEDIEKIEKVNSEININNQNYKIIKDTIARLKEEGYDIMKFDFKKILTDELKKLSISTFKYLGKENLIINQYYFTNHMIRKFIYDKMEKEESEKYKFIFSKKPRHISEILNEKRKLKKIIGISASKFKDTILKSLESPMTSEEKEIRNQLIIKTKKAIESYYSEKPDVAKKIIDIIDKDYKDLVESDITEMELLFHE